MVFEKERGLPMKLDSYDMKILACLQQDGRMSHAALSEQVNLSASQCSRRLQQLEQQGIIAGYRAEIDPQVLGLDVVALINVTLEKQQENIAIAFEKSVQEQPEILECVLITGDGDYELRVMARNLQHFSGFISDKLMRMPGVSSIKSNIRLSQVKQTKGLPLSLIET